MGVLGPSFVLVLPCLFSLGFSFSFLADASNSLGMAILRSFALSFIYFVKIGVKSSCFLGEIGCLGLSAGFGIPTVVKSFLLSFVAFNL